MGRGTVGRYGGVGLLRQASGFVLTSSVSDGFGIRQVRNLIVSESDRFGIRKGRNNIGVKSYRYDLIRET